MTPRLLLMAMLAPAALHAQLALFAVNGTTETAIASAYNIGPVAVGDKKTVTIRARNLGNDLIVVSRIALSGMNFAIVNTSSPPFAVAPGLTLDIRVEFSASSIPGQNFTANLQVNSILVQLTATSAAAATLTVASPCIGPDSQGTISFGRVQQGGQVTCTISLQNASTQNLAVSPVTVAGAQFSTISASSITILAGQTFSSTIKFTAPAAATYAGTFVVGPRTYALSGTGFVAPLQAPLFSFDAATFTSGQQYALTVSLPQASPVTASGTLTLAFTPSGTVVTDDTAVQFVATSKRVASFTVTQGATAVRLNNEPSAVFSSGTTAGMITFSLDAGAFGIAGASTASIILAPIPVAVTAASATRRANDLDITLSGFDNTYSTGPMSFTFYDRSGATIGSAIATDFTSAFRTFFQGQISGSSFLMRVSFPVTGNAQAVGGVDVTLHNTAGSTRTQRLGFP